MEDFVVSARKYRPDTFGTVIGQKAITETLKNSIRNGHLAQSFLFCGPRGVGKTTCARILARTINCTNPGPDMEPCGECESCKGFLHNASQNIYELDAASNRNVEAMRTLVEQVRIPPQVGKYKVYIIDEVHMLTSEAFNAFLKTLEEPPAYAKFILATTEKNKIIPTILSRCQIFDFKRITIDDMVEHLKNICEKEGISFEEDALRVVAQKADGGLRDALSMFDQIVSFSGNSITYKQTISMLNILDYETYFEMFGHFLQGNVPGALNLFNQVLENGFDGQTFVGGLSGHLRTLMMMKETQTEALVESSPRLRQRYKEQGEACSLAQLLAALECGNQCDLQYRNSNHKRLLVEILLLQMVRIFKASALQGGEARGASVGELPEAAAQPAAAQPAAAPVPLKPAAARPETAARPVATDVAAVRSEAAAPAPAPQPVVPPVSSQPAVSSQSAVLSQPVVAQQPAQVQVQPPVQSEVKPQPVVAPAPTPQAPQAAPAGRPFRSATSLQGLSAQSQAKNAAPQEITSVQPDKDFSQFALDQQWKAYVEAIQTAQPSLANILSMAKPTLGKDYAVELTAANGYAAETLTQGQKSVLDFLREKLQNRALHFVVKVDESLKPDTPIYTPQEKFQEMVKNNPELQNLRDTLHLGVEL